MNRRPSYSLTSYLTDVVLFDEIKMGGEVLIACINIQCMLFRHDNLLFCAKLF